MARNWEKYMYVELAIPRSSAWFPLLEAEAEAKGQTLAQVALERLANIYLRENRLSAMSRASTSLPATSSTPKTQLSQPGAADLEDEAEPHLNDNQAANNAAAFLDNGGFF
ncbi:MAG TPA: hypothetical protein VF458_22705 [Ktedonobacteraceae bacterium]